MDKFLLAFFLKLFNTSRRPRIQNAVLVTIGVMGVFLHNCGDTAMHES